MRSSESRSVVPVTFVDSDKFVGLGPLLRWALEQTLGSEAGHLSTCSCWRWRRVSGAWSEARSNGQQSPGAFLLHPEFFWLVASQQHPLPPSPRWRALRFPLRPCGLIRSAQSRRLCL